MIIGPGINDVQFSAIKEFSVTERYRAQFRAEFFNVFNHANFGCGGKDFSFTQSQSADAGACSDPVNTATSAALGQLTTAGDGRVIQFGLKMFW